MMRAKAIDRDLEREKISPQYPYVHLSMEILRHGSLWYQALSLTI